MLYIRKGVLGSNPNPSAIHVPLCIATSQRPFRTSGTTRALAQLSWRPFGLKRLHGSIKSRIAAAIDGLAVNSRPTGVAKLAGLDDFRIRVGDHRIVYAVDDSRHVVLVARIAHRREVYRP
jgi:mRNA interferase RelE/StbE